MGKLLQRATVFILTVIVAAAVGLGGGVDSTTSGTQMLIYGSIALLALGFLVAVARRG